MKAHTEQPTGKDPIVWLIEIDDKDGHTCYFSVDDYGFGFQPDKKRAIQFTEDSATRAAPFISKKVRVVPHPVWTCTAPKDQPWDYEMDRGSRLPEFHSVI